MKKIFQWAMAAALICGISFAVASCSNDDNLLCTRWQADGSTFQQGVTWKKVE